MIKGYSDTLSITRYTTISKECYHTDLFGSDTICIVYHTIMTTLPLNRLELLRCVWLIENSSQRNKKIHVKSFMQMKCFVTVLLIPEMTEINYTTFLYAISLHHNVDTSVK